MMMTERGTPYEPHRYVFPEQRVQAVDVLDTLGLMVLDEQAPSNVRLEAAKLFIDGVKTAQEINAFEE